MFDGTVRTGSVVSTIVTVTVKLLLAVLPAASLAEHVTVVVPTGNFVSDAGLQVTVTDGSTLSVAVAI